MHVHYLTASAAGRPSPGLSTDTSPNSRASSSPCSDNYVETAPQPELVAQLAQEAYSNDLFHLLVTNMWRFEFEVRGDVLWRQSRAKAGARR